MAKKEKNVNENFIDFCYDPENGHHFLTWPKEQLHIFVSFPSFLGVQFFQKSLHSNTQYCGDMEGKQKDICRIPSRHLSHLRLRS